MLKNFDELKRQLTELAGVINLYKNESVQLKIVELVFQRTTDQPETKESDSKSPATRRSRTAKRATARNREAHAAPKNSGRTRKLGAVGVLNLLLSEGFFKTNRKIGEIVEHSRSKLATTIKVTNLSGPLARFVRDKKLDRVANAEGQYEYLQK